MSTVDWAYAPLNAETGVRTVQQVGLPTNWKNKDGSVTAGFFLLGQQAAAGEQEAVTELLSKSWFPVENDIPTFDGTTQEVKLSGYEVLADKVIAHYTVHALPPPPPYVPTIDERVLKLEGTTVTLGSDTYNVIIPITAPSKRITIQADMSSPLSNSDVTIKLNGDIDFNYSYSTLSTQNQSVESSFANSDSIRMTTALIGADFGNVSGEIVISNGVGSIKNISCQYSIYDGIDVKQKYITGTWTSQAPITTVSLCAKSDMFKAGSTFKIKYE